MNERELLAIRLSVIQRIVNQCEDIGKTKVQKITYFLQESVGVPSKYPFRMHYYGPYSDDLDGDLSLAQMLGYVEIERDSDGYGYHVTPGSERVVEDFGGHDSISDLASSMTGAIDILAQLETVDLELYATIHFIGRSRKDLATDEVLRTVQRLKPKFSEPYIKRAYEKLEQAELI